MTVRILWLEFLVITFHIWLISSYDDLYDITSMDELGRDYRSALNHPLGTEDLQDDPEFATATSNIQLDPNHPQYYFTKARVYLC